MATESSIAMTLVANTRHFNSALRKSKMRVASLGTAAKRTGRSMKSMGALALRSLGAFAGISAIVGGLRSLATSAEGFNREMLRSLAIMDDVSDKLKGKMVDAAFASAKATQFSTKETAKAFFDLFSANMSVNQAIEAMPVVARFAQAGNFDLAQATDLLTDAQTALGLAVEDPIQNLKNLTRVGDVLVKANKLATATTEQFAKALVTKAASASKFFGISVEETVAVLAAFAKAGKKAELGGTQFDIFLREITNKVVKNADAWKEMGIRVFDNRGKVRKLADVVEDLSRAFGSLTPEMKIVAQETLGLTLKSFAATRALFGMSESIRETEKFLLQAGGTMKKVADSMMTPLMESTADLEVEWTKLGKSSGFNFIWASWVKSAALTVRAWNFVLTLGASEAMKAQPIIKKLFDEFAEDRVRPIRESARVLSTFTMKLRNATLSAKELAEQAKKLKEALELKVSATGSFKKFFEDLKHEVAEFNLSFIDQEINALVRRMKDAGVDVIPKGAIKRARQYGQELQRLADEADAFDTLKSKALNLARSTRTPLEKFNEQIALMHKLATTPDPKTGKFLIDTDTLNRGLRKARELLRALKDDVRGFLAGKRETVSRMNAVTLAAIANRVAGQKAGGGGGGGFAFGGAGALGGRATIHPRPISAAGPFGNPIQYLARIEDLLRTALSTVPKTRVN